MTKKRPTDARWPTWALVNPWAWVWRLPATWLLWGATAAAVLALSFAQSQPVWWPLLPAVLLHTAMVGWGTFSPQARRWRALLAQKQWGLALQDLHEQNLHSVLLPPLTNWLAEAERCLALPPHLHHELLLLLLERQSLQQLGLDADADACTARITALLGPWARETGVPPLPALAIGPGMVS